MPTLFDLAAGKVPPKAEPVPDPMLVPIVNTGAELGNGFSIGQRVRTNKVLYASILADVHGASGVYPRRHDGALLAWLEKHGRPDSEFFSHVDGVTDQLRRPNDEKGACVPSGWLADVLGKVDSDSRSMVVRIALPQPDGTTFVAYISGVTVNDVATVRGRPYVKGLDPVRGGFDRKEKGVPPAGNVDLAKLDERIDASVRNSFAPLADAQQKAMSGVLEGAMDGFKSVLAEVDERINKARPVVIKVGKRPDVRIDLAHVTLPRTLALVANGFNVMLVGPAGCGKTTLGEQVATALGRSFAAISCSLGMPESVIVGKCIPNISGGTDRYVRSSFVRLFTEGGVFLADEMDAADASTLLLFNSAIANGFINLPTGELARRHEDFSFIAACNTFGNGADRMYVGRSQLDAATQDRFVGATLSLDYDRDLETRLCPDDLIRKRVWHIRDKARELKLRRTVSTRMILACNTLVHQVGDSLDVALLAVTEGWTAEDRKACGVTR